jgi:hypothetical protein
VGSYTTGPPWSSRPLPDLLPTTAALTRLTSLRLLRGLRRVADTQQLPLVSRLPWLVNLGLHDTALAAEDLLALARCPALESLSVRAGRSRAGPRARPRPTAVRAKRTEPP